MKKRNKLSGFLMSLRVSKGLTQDELAALSGISQGQIAKIEQCGEIKMVSQIFKLAKAYKIEPTFFFRSLYAND